MGCGASASQVHPMPSGIVPSFHDLVSARQQQTISEAAARHSGHGLGLAVKRRPQPCSFLDTRCDSGLTIVPEEVETEDTKPSWSSWDSSHWKSSHLVGAPSPPDRRLHDRHLHILDQFQKDVEQQPKKFTKMVEAGR
ncbi:unnamed protein product [Symbiodinium necroappetens]|uniref:Uncharacterized protein n=1 Tax=Symbiodinium necroappetens TaxID=1628268 RepID=A0A812MY47_9DINO|nr:unnamed protein product [Symbiodinium necroappetens]|mmetsp:Transcript_131213/g.311197  ORF Transcript_131213/g.311197 Transcript_131213/m.311197 type:complete len:138 (-) Transcript_131213:163-576(-)